MRCQTPPPSRPGHYYAGLLTYRAAQAIGLNFFLATVTQAQVFLPNYYIPNAENPRYRIETQNGTRCSVEGGARTNLVIGAGGGSQNYPGGIDNYYDNSAVNGFIALQIPLGNPLQNLNCDRFAEIETRRAELEYLRTLLDESLIDETTFQAVARQRGLIPVAASPSTAMPTSVQPGAFFPPLPKQR
jgi:hypothetical protein